MCFVDLDFTPLLARMMIINNYIGPIENHSSISYTFISTAKCIVKPRYRLNNRNRQILKKLKHTI